MFHQFNLACRSGVKFLYFILALTILLCTLLPEGYAKPPSNPRSIVQGGSLDCRTGLGGQVFSTGTEIEIRIEASEADFTDEIYLFAPERRLLGTNKDTGKVVRFTFPTGNELVFGIIVRETGQTFQIGPSPRNPDGLFHATVNCLGNDTARIGFEDFFGGGDQDYDDAVLFLRAGAPSSCGNGPVGNSTLAAKQIAMTGPSLMGSFLSTIQATSAKSAGLPSDVQQLESDMRAVTPFIVTNEEGRQHLLKQDAHSAGVTNEALTVGQRLVGLNNRIIDAASKDKEKVPSFEAEDVAFLKPLFEHWAEFGLPDFESASLAQMLRIGQSVAQNSCGSIGRPTPCPPKVESGLFFSSQAEVTQHLNSLGYHLTPPYATTPDGFGLDFTKVVDDPCGPSTFRSEAVIRRQGACWTYYTQGPEPNPEVLSYVRDWPYVFWPAYVFWYHNSFC